MAPDARQDMRDILLHTRRQWSDEQRRVYREALDRALDSLRTYPERGRVRDDVAVDIRGLPVQQHVIYYRIEAGTVRVLRIFHVKMDAASRLGE